MRTNIMQHLENFIDSYKRLRNVYDIENNPIEEKFGTYEGQVELASMLSSFMLANKKWMQFEITKEELSKQDIKGIFYEKLIIDWSTNKSSYDAYSSKLANGLFDKVFIRIDCQLTTYKEIAKALLHELTHAWHNYCLMTKSNKDLVDVINDQSHIRQLILKGKISGIASKSDLEYKIFKSVDDLEYKIFKSVDDLCYFTREEELKAFKSELKAEILAVKSNIDLDFNLFLKMLKSSETYSACNSLLYSLEIVNQLDNNAKKLFADAYASIKMSNWQFDKIYKREKRRLEETKDEIEKLGAKIYCEWVEKISNKPQLSHNEDDSLDIMDIKFDIKVSKKRVEEHNAFNSHDRFMSLLIYESLRLRNGDR